MSIREYIRILDVELSPHQAGGREPLIISTTAGIAGNYYVEDNGIPGNGTAQIRWPGLHSIYTHAPASLPSKAGRAGVAGQLLAEQGAGKTLISGDVNGDAAADFTIGLSGPHTLTATDFRL